MSKNGTCGGERSGTDVSGKRLWRMWFQVRAVRQHQVALELRDVKVHLDSAIDGAQDGSHPGMMTVGCALRSTTQRPLIS